MDKADKEDAMATRKKIQSEFGRRLAEAIERSGKTRYQVAVESEMSATYLYQITGGHPNRKEGGGVDRAVSLAKRLATSCGCTPEELLGL